MVSTSWPRLTLEWKSRMMLGKATFTIVASSKTMNDPTVVTVSESQRRSKPWAVFDVKSGFRQRKKGRLRVPASRQFTHLTSLRHWLAGVKGESHDQASSRLRTALG